jgi:putative spermidine/putrescine transport system substrate-binding protein
LATKHSMPRLLTIGAAFMFIASACGGGATTAPSVAATAPGATAAGGSPAASTTALVPWTPDATKLTAAKAEGGLNLIAVPRDWCNYGAIIDDYTAKTGIPIKVITPDAGSGAEHRRPDDT